ncbi:hypothetical protein OIU76_025077 [Salix suchowensis]|nr:hypothetical protein OIU76_025077 [Salix suchowensis]
MTGSHIIVFVISVAQHRRPVLKKVMRECAEEYGYVAGALHYSVQDLATRRHPGWAYPSELARREDGWKDTVLSAGSTIKEEEEEEGGGGGGRRHLLTFAMFTVKFLDKEIVATWQNHNTTRPNPRLPPNLRSPRHRRAPITISSFAINVLRFSPSGELLASGADGGELIIWKLHSTETGQTWKVLKNLLFHRKDVLDLEWSADSAYLISGSVDNSCIIWDVNKGSVHQLLDGHFHYVQGVAWDPLAKYIASISSDRTCRIYVNKPQTKTKGAEKMNYVSQHVIMKAEQQMSTKTHLFHDETLPSFFRRLAWSPDGSFLLVPAGSYKMAATSETVNTAYAFSRMDLSRPAVMLPGASKPVVAVRFCPVPFNLRGLASGGLFKLPYRLIFAVATLNSLYIYDTESVPPIAILAGLHYAAITDISWSSNAQYLALSSRDGYCTLVEFEANELGSPTSFADERKDAVHQNKSPDAQEPESMIIETTTNNGCVAADSGKTVVTNNEGKAAITNLHKHSHLK